MGESTTLCFDALTKDNYNTWRNQAEVLLKVGKLWNHVKDDESISGDGLERAIWMKNDEIVKSKLIQHVSNSLLPLVENCKTSREIWSKLANVYGDKGKKQKAPIIDSNDDDEDAIIDGIENSVKDFFNIITDSSEPKITEGERSLKTSKKFAEDLFTRLRMNGVEKLPDEKIIIDTVAQFIDAIRKLRNVEIKDRRNELSGEFIDILLAKFNINPHKNNNDETESNSEGAEIRDNNLGRGGRRKERNDGGLSELITPPLFDTAGTRNKTIRNNGVSTEMGESTTLFFGTLTKDNYNTWRIQAEVLLKVDKLWDHVKDDELIPGDGLKRVIWMKNDEIAKSELIQHISNSLLPLVETCKTSREIWSKLADVYGEKDKKQEASIIDSNTDGEDAIIDGIENTVEDLFDIISDLSEAKITEGERSLNISKKCVQNLFTRLRMNGVEKLPDEKIIIDTVAQFIDAIRKLRNVEIKDRRNELSGELIDILLAKFNINPHKNNNDETESNSEGAEIRDNDLGGRGKNGNDSDCSKLIKPQLPRDTDGTFNKTIPENEVFTKYAESTQNERFAEDEGSTEDEFEDCNGMRQPEQHISQSIPYESFDQRGAKSSMSNLSNLCTPPPTPSPRRTYKCGVCGEEGHNRTRCPQNKLTASKSTAIYETPKRSYKCGICGVEGHNRTTCSLNKPAVTTPTKSITAEYITGTPKKSYKCGICGVEGHNRTTCSLNKPAVTTPSKSITTNITGTPKRSYKCGICGVEGHNRTTCSLNKPAAAAAPRSYTPTIPGTLKRSYKCGICGVEGHNRTTCSLNKPAASAPSQSIITNISETPKRSYKCGLCGGEGHNRTTCSLNQPAAAAPTYTSNIIPETPQRSYKCGLCGGQGHNRTTCSLNQPAAAAPTYTFNIIPETPKRSVNCGLCGGQGHNRRTCSLNQPAAAAPTYTSNIIPETPKRTVNCGLCGGQGHNRRTCSLNKPTVSASEYYTSAPVYEAPQRSYRCGICGLEGHNSRTCSRRESSSSYDYGSSASYSSYAPAASYSSSGGGRRTQSCGICGRPGHNRRTCTEG